MTYKPGVCSPKSCCINLNITLNHKHTLSSQLYVVAPIYKMPYRKALIIFLLCCPALHVLAQRPLINMSEHDHKKYYFGIVFGMNYSVYQIKYTSAFANTDTFKQIQPQWQPGFNLGLLGNLRLTNFIDVRFLPQLIFAEKRLVFEYGLPKDSVSDRSIESILMSLPLQVKFKSERINNSGFTLSWVANLNMTWLQMPGRRIPTNSSK